MSPCVPVVPLSACLFLVNSQSGVLTREVMPPQRPDLILPSHIPHIEFDILVSDRLNIKAHSRNGRDVLIKLEFVEDRCDTSYQQLQVSGRIEERRILVFPAASNPSMSRRISLDPKILFIIFDTCPPMATVAIRRASLAARGKIKQ